MYRFYSENESFSSKQITLKQTDEIHHIKNVLRLKKNTKIAIFNGKDKEGIGVITSIHKNTVDIDIHKIRTINHKMPTLILACAIPKKSKFEFIIEKATELGVDQIYPIKTKRTEFALNGERLNKKIQRYQTVAINAAKQSKRITIPQIHAMTSFKLAMTQLSQHSTIIIPSLSGKPKALNSILNTIKSQNISIFVGPEGDFTKEEYAFAHQLNALPVSLGPTILKVETAALSTLSFIRLHALSKTT